MKKLVIILIIFLVFTSAASAIDVVNSSLNPNKVLPGDIMNILSEVKDPFGISSINVEMPHEKGSDILFLELINGTNKDGVWAGEWVVHDTIEKEYISRFTVTNILKEVYYYFLNWFDPPRYCSVDGSASSTGVTCSGMNEDATDATSDGCTDGTTASYMHVQDLILNASSVSSIEQIEVICTVYCYSSGTEYSIRYNNGSGTWTNKQYGNCLGAGYENKTVSFTVDPVVGTHYVRCWESWSTCTDTTECCSDTYGDDDDMNFTVEAAGYVFTVSQPLNQSTTPNVNVSYDFTISNTGGLIDTYNIGVINWDSADTADVNVSSIVNVGTGSSVMFALNVTDANSGAYIVTVNVSSDNDPSISELVNVTTNVGGILTSTQITPSGNYNATQNQTFTYTTRITCTSGLCGNVSASLDPITNLVLNGGFETGDLTSWLTGGNANWAAEAATEVEGSYAAKSGVILDNQNSWISQNVTLTEAANITFNWNVSSEASWDYLGFCVNKDFGAVGCTRGVDDASTGPIAGTVAWTLVTYELSAGENQLLWYYAKDGSALAGNDSGMIDNVTISVTSSIKSGAVSTTVGDEPFYTTSNNPQNSSTTACLEDMNSGESCDISWTVNATGEIDTIHEFFVIFDSDFVSGVNSSSLNVTIGELSAGNNVPVVNDIELISTNIATNGTDENITVYYNVSDSDAESVYNITNWFLNDVSINLLNMPFEANLTAESETTVKDYSGYGNNGTVSGAIWNNESGYDGFGDFEFDGIDDQINITWTDELNISGSFTVSAWIKLNVENEQGGIISHAGSMEAPWTLEMVDGKPKFTMDRESCDGGVGITIVDPLSINEWHYVVSTFDLSDKIVSIYVDGNLEEETDPGFFAIDSVCGANYNITIGSTYNAHVNNNLNGSIDSVMIYNHTLSAEEISALYQNRTDLIVAQETTVGDIWQACVTPNDNIEDGTEVCSNDLEVLGNNIPVVDDIELISTDITTNDTNENLTMYYNVSDLDANNVYNITNWFLNDVSIMLLNMPFEANLTAESETKVKDYSGYGNNGTVTGAVWNSVGGYDGFGAYQFDGLSQYIKVNYDQSLNLSDAFTISVWIYPVESGDDGGIVGGEGGLVPWTLDISDGKIDYLIGHTNCGGGSGAVSANVLDLNEWHHIVGLYNGSAQTYYLYVDGQYDDHTSGLSSILCQQEYNITIGVTDSRSVYFNGSIDDVRLYNRTLSVEEVKALYENRTDLIVSQETTVGDIWQACVTPNDNIDDGLEVCSNELEVLGSLNDIPVVDDIELISTDVTTNYTDENLTVYYNVSDSDAESVYNITNWYVNSQSILSLNMPFEANLTAESDTKVKDYSGYGNNGTVTGAVWNSAGGYDGFGAYQFDGVSQYIKVNYDQSLNLSDAFTTSVWIYPVESGDNGGIFGSEGGLVPWTLDISNGKISYTIGDTNCMGSGGGTSVNVLDLNQWHHIVGLYNGSEQKYYLYVDGQNDRSSSALSSILCQEEYNITIGVTDGGTVYFNGSIDDVRLYNRTLSVEEVVALYENRTDLIVSQETTVGDVWQACVTPNDNIEDGLEVCSNELEVLAPFVGNNIPNTAQMFVNATSPNNYTTDDLTCYANITDDDGGNVYGNYTWFNNSVEHLNGLSSAFTAGTLSLIATLDSGNTTIGENWTCSVQAYDGIDNESDWNNDSIIILNGIPSVDIIELISTDVTTNDTNENLTVYYNVSDNEMDDIKNITNWYESDESITILDMPFDANSTAESGTKVKDYSGYGNNATVIAATYSNESGVDGKGAYTFATTKSLAIPDNPTLRNTGNLTLIAWIYPTSEVTYHFMFEKGYEDDDNYAFYLEYDELAFEYNDTGGTYRMFDTSNANIPLNQWTHVVVTIRDDQELNFYKNGIKIQTNTTLLGALNSKNYDLLIGRQNYTAQELPFIGKLDEIKMFNRTLSAEQISALYNNETYVLVSNELLAGDVWQACVTPNDNTDDGLEVCSNDLEVLGPAVSNSDLSLNDENITFSNDNPIEGESVIIAANVTNIGSGDASNVKVQFLNNSIEINNVTMNILAGATEQANVTWIAEIGTYNITIVVDPDNSITEDSKTNNNASKNITVGAYHTFYGSTSGGKALGSGLDLLYSISSNVQNIYVSHIDSNVDFNNLQSIGRTTADGASTNDFTEIDTLLGMSSLNDSISIMYSSDGTTPLSVETIEVYNNLIDNVPIANSSNDAIYTTGILWDMSDDGGDGEFSQGDVEDLVFITTNNASQATSFGVVDYVAQIPALLRIYKVGENRLEFYLELN